MTTPGQCTCGEAGAKVQGVVISLRVMRAGLQALEEQIDQLLASAEAELKQAGERACPEDRMLQAPACESTPQGSAEADIASHDLPASDGLVDPAVVETADTPTDIGAQRANETTIFEQKRASLADSGTNSDLATTADAPNEASAAEDPMSTGATGVMDCLSTSCNDEIKTEPALEPADGSTGDHEVEPESSEGAASQDAGDDVESTPCERNIVTLAGRRHRMFRNVAASIAASVVLMGLIVATKFETLDGLKSLAHATGLR